jgi:hypothetical protein
MPSLGRPGPCAAPSTQVERSVRSSRCVQRAVRRLPCRQRRVWPTQPASVGAGEQRGESPTRVRGSIGSTGCARASTSVAEVGERRRGPEKRASAGKRWAWTRTRVPRRSSPRGEGGTGASKASTTGTAVAKPRSRERPEPDVRKDVAGQRSSLDGRRFPIVSSSDRSRERMAGRSRRLSDGLGDVRTSTARRERRQERQRLGTHASRREDNAHRDDLPSGTTCDPPKRIALTCISQYSSKRRRSCGARQENRRGAGTDTKT